MSTIMDGDSWLMAVLPLTFFTLPKHSNTAQNSPTMTKFPTSRSSPVRTHVQSLWEVLLEDCPPPCANSP